MYMNKRIWKATKETSNRWYKEKKGNKEAQTTLAISSEREKCTRKCQQFQK